MVVYILTDKSAIQVFVHRMCSVLFLQDSGEDSVTPPERYPVFTHGLCLMNCEVAADPIRIR